MVTLTPVLNISIGSTYTHAELVKTFHVGVGGGIRYRGPADHPDFVLVITSKPGTYVDRPDRRRPYHDRWAEGMLWYTGAGKKDHQELTRGNLALYMQPVHHYPIFLFEQTAPDHYEYQGEFRVTGVVCERQLDEANQHRHVYVFQLSPVHLTREALQASPS